MNQKRFLSKRILCGLITFFLICSLSIMPQSMVFAEDSFVYELNTCERTDMDFIKSSGEANRAYSALMDYYNKSDSNRYIGIYGKYTVTGSYAAAFPEYYCGSYINKYGNLVLLLNQNLNKNEIEKAKKLIDKIIGGYVPIYAFAEYSYCQLVSVMSNISESIGKNCDFNITGFAIDDYANRVILYVDRIDDVVETWVNSNIVNSDCVKIELKAYYDESTANASCAQEITYNGSFSIGFRAQYNNSGTAVSGLITCGHGFPGNNLNYNVYYNSNYFGYMVSGKRSFYNGGNTDAAFVKCADGNSVTNMITTATGYTYNISQVCYTNIAMGSNVYMYGFASYNAGAGLQSGSVYSVSYSSPVADTNITLYDLVQTSYYTYLGDSGGPVVFYDSGKYKPVGNQSLRSSGATYSMYDNIANTLSALGVYLY